jgi:hypothetical protein
MVKNGLKSVKDKQDEACDNMLNGTLRAGLTEKAMLEQGGGRGPWRACAASKEHLDRTTEAKESKVYKRVWNKVCGAEAGSMEQKQAQS